MGSRPTCGEADSLLSVTDHGNGPADGTTSGVPQSSFASVTTIVVSAPPVAPCESVAVSATGQRPARSNVCVTLVAPLMPGMVDQSSGNVHFTDIGSPFGSFAVPFIVSVEPRAMNCVTGADA